MTRIGLVMGAGGIVGASYVAGALEGVRRATGFTPTHAELVLGTSAGAFIGALVTSGLPVWAMHEQCTGESDHGEPIDAALRAYLERLDSHNRGSWLARFVPARRVPRPVLASPALFMRGVRSPRAQPFELTLSGLLGEGLFSTSSIEAIVRGAAPVGWPEQTLWVMACDMDRGERVRLDRQSGLSLPEAVSAATAIPGLFAPVRRGGRRLVDGGLHSSCHLDLVADQALDAVLCIHPMGGAAAQPGSKLGVRRRIRRRADEQLARERAAVEAKGTPVYVLHPSAEELVGLPRNPMDLSVRSLVMKRAARAVAEQLRTRADLAPLAAWLREAALVSKESRQRGVHSVAGTGR